MKPILRIVAFIVAMLAGAPAFAQSNPNWGYGFVPTPGQWNAEWSTKQDYLGAPPILTTGGTMTGKLITAPSTAFSAGLNVGPGVAPTSPIDGDIWTTVAGVYARINGTTIGPLSGPSGGSFAATSPLSVTFPSGVVTYACVTCAVTTNPLSQFASTTSAQMLGVISDETGTGSLVFGTSPTFTTSIFTPAVWGGASASATLNIQASTSGVPSGDNLNLIASTITAARNGSGATVFNVGISNTSNGRINIAGSTSGSTGIIPAAVASGLLTLPAATDTLVGKATTDTFTNKIIDSAGTGNSIRINGTAIAAVTGSANTVVLQTSPTLITPVLGVATATSINGNTIVTGTGSLNLGTFTVAFGGAFSSAAAVTHAGAFARTITATAVSNATLPAGTQTLAALGLGQTWTALQGFNDSQFALNGSTSGSLVLRSAAASASSVIRFPSGSTDFSATGGAGQYVKQVSAGAALTVAGIAAADLPVATTGALGAVRPDGTTITISGGVITASGASATAVTVGTTNVVSGTSGSYLTNNSGILGEAFAATKAVQQAASSTTAVVTPSQQQSHPSSPKAIVFFSSISGTLVQGFSYNVGTVTRVGVGQYSIPFTTPFANATFACTFGLDFAAGGLAQNNRVSTKSTTGLAVLTTDNTYNPADTAGLSMICSGTQ